MGGCLLDLRRDGTGVAVDFCLVISVILLIGAGIQIWRALRGMPK